MTSKGAKETIVSRLGFKSSSSAPKAEAELERVRKENAHLRKKIDEVAKRHIKPPDSDKSKLLEVKEVSWRTTCGLFSPRTLFLHHSYISWLLLLFFFLSFLLTCACSFLCWSFQRILSLETLRERNNQQLLVKEQELQTLRQQLTARGGEVGTHDTSPP